MEGAYKTIVSHFLYGFKNIHKESHKRLQKHFQEHLLDLTGSRDKIIYTIGDLNYHAAVIEYINLNNIQGVLDATDGNVRVDFAKALNIRV